MLRVSGFSGAKRTNFNMKDRVTADIVRTIQDMKMILNQVECHHLRGSIFPGVSSLFNWLYCIRYSTKIFKLKKYGFIIWNNYIFVYHSLSNIIFNANVSLYSYLDIINFTCEHGAAKLCFTSKSPHGQCSYLCIILYITT